MNPQTHSHKLHLFRFASISNLDDLRCCGKKGSCKCSMPEGFCVDQMPNQSQLLWKYQNFYLISSPIYRLFFPPFYPFQLFSFVILCSLLLIINFQYMHKSLLFLSFEWKNTFKLPACEFFFCNFIACLSMFSAVQIRIIFFIFQRRHRRKIIAKKKGKFTTCWTNSTP